MSVFYFLYDSVNALNSPISIKRELNFFLLITFQYKNAIQTVLN